MTPPRLASRSLFALTFIALAWGCASEPPPPPEPDPVRVESPGLGIVIAALEAPFSVAVNEGETLELTTADGGTLEIARGPEERSGVNLVEAVKERQAAMEGLPDGVFHGSRELMTPIGSAFTARGTYSGDAGPVEETWIYALHPSGNRLLTLVYRYPPGDSERRVGELVGVLGEIEPI